MACPLNLGGSKGFDRAHLVLPPATHKAKPRRRPGQQAISGNSVDQNFRFSPA